MAVLGSPLIRVNMNLNKVPSFLGSVTWNAVSTFAMNANTSLFSPLNGATNSKASPTEIYSFILAVLLPGLATSACKLGYRMGMNRASVHFALYGAWVDDTLWTGTRWRLLVSAILPGS